jgi:hypothetical protein
MRRKAKYINPLDIILLGDEPFGISDIQDYILPSYRAQERNYKRLDGYVFINSQEERLIVKEDDYVDKLVEPNVI